MEDPLGEGTDLDEDHIQEMAQSRPYVIQVIQTQILQDLAGMTEEMLRILQRQRPDGAFSPHALTVTTDEAEELTPESVRSMPWRGFDVFHDDGDPVHVILQSRGDTLEAPIKAGETLSLDYSEPVVRELVFRVETGSADIRVYGSR